jgi:hypothetical protein
MATLDTNNRFQSWVLTPEEFITGGILSSLQKQVIQNQIAQVATQKINLVFDPLNFQRFIQEEAGLAGQIAALDYLLTLSAEAEKQFDPGLQQIEIPFSSNPQD